jgi:hypothetical protein
MRPLRARRGLAGMWGGRTGGPLHAGIIRRFRGGPLRSPVDSSILHSRIGCSLFFRFVSYEILSVTLEKIDTLD